MANKATTESLKTKAQAIKHEADRASKAAGRLSKALEGRAEITNDQAVRIKLILRLLLQLLEFLNHLAEELGDKTDPPAFEPLDAPAESLLP